jgi:hypothetical protein
VKFQHVLVAVAAIGSFVTVGASPAAADHNTCGSGHLFQYNVTPVELSTGTTDSFDGSDFWHDLSPVSNEGLRLIVLEPATGDTDLYVWNSTCTGVICRSLASSGPDQCLVNVSGGTYVEARNYGGGSSQYTLSVTYSPLFV